MRTLVITALLAGAVSARADRLIQIPTGTKIFKNTLRLEYLAPQSKLTSRRYGVHLPIGEAFDGFIGGDHKPGSRHDRLLVDLSYNAVVPIVDISPGISVGVRDLFNVSRDRRSYFLAVTNKVGQDGRYNSELPAEVTYGIGAGGIRGVFLGIVIPVTTSWRLIAEHDSTRLTAGLEIRPIKDFSARWLFRQQETMLQLSWTVRF